VRERTQLTENREMDYKPLEGYIYTLPEHNQLKMLGMLVNLNAQINAYSLKFLRAKIFEVE